MGPAGEEIYTDEFGRVKVQFPWDRDGKSNETSSCWIRVAQVGAGPGFGNTVIPRINHEVIVSFLEGDPDQPIVTGATFHATNKSSLNLPADKTKMAFRGKTHDGGGTGSGYNELSFENDDGRQMVHIHAQKDMDTKVLNDRTTHVLNDHSEKVDHDQSVNIGNDQTIGILNNQTETIDGNQTLLVKKNQAETVYIAKAETIGAAKALSIGAAYQVTVGAAMSEAVGLFKNMAIGKNYMQQVGGNKVATIAKNQTVTIAHNENTQIGKSKKMVIKDHLKLTAGKSIEIVCGKSKIFIEKSGKITISGDMFTVKTTGNQTLKAKRDIIIKGKQIKEN